MKHYRVKLIGQITGSPYRYSIPLAEDVPPIEAKSQALALHTDAFISGEISEQVYNTGASIKPSPRCWSLQVRRWRLVRCVQDCDHRRVTKWHYSPKGDAWKVKHYE